MQKRSSIARLSMIGGLRNKSQRKAIINPNEDLNLIQENTGLSVEKIKLIKQIFEKYSNNGCIQNNNMMDILNESGIKFNPNTRQIIADDIAKYNGQKIDLIKFCNFYVDAERKIESTSKNSEYVDAFVAMGGNIDRTGTIKRSVIIDIIKVTFELTFDIEDFMSKQEVNSQELDFNEFCTLFDQNMQESRNIISGLSRRYKESQNDIEQLIKESNKNYKTDSINSNDSDEDFKDLDVNYKDFQKWLLKDDKTVFI